MRLFFILILTVITFQSCSTSSDDSFDEMQEDNSMSVINNNDDSGNNNDTSGVAYQGDFVSSAHETVGKATVNPEKTVLNFTGFKTSNGPLLDVYLATDTSAGTYIDLGVLKGVDGDYQYDLPSNVDYSTYKYVIIWCVDFNVNFGYAVLE